MPNLQEFIADLNSKFSEIVGGSFCKMDSGEIFTRAEVQKYVQERLKKFTTDQFIDANKEVSKAFGVNSDQILRTNKKPPKKPRIKTKDEYDNGNFNIVYRCMLEEVYNMKLDNNEKLVFYVLRDFISYPSNSIMFNGQVLTFPDFESIVGLKERTIRKAVKSLEEKGLFKLKQSGHKKQIFVNPSYYASGKELDIDTLKMFGILECDDDKVNSYINDDNDMAVKNKINKQVTIEDTDNDDPDFDDIDEPDFSLQDVFEILDRQEAEYSKAHVYACDRLFQGKI